ncbi:hypothetical protein [Phaeobacter sp. C3_T13_0]|uniref:hypothetical protein n=1 Tax=Phaeobacter cretensis TaxID=3342641 RepID=UPI0039BD4E94
MEYAAHQGLAQEIVAANAMPVPFVTDGCSGGLSAIWRQITGDGSLDGGPPFEACCVAHDRLYHNAAGIGRNTRERSAATGHSDVNFAAASQLARLDADRDLRRCVETRLMDQSSVAAPTATTVAAVMYRAVRFGGAPCSGLSWRWGYGYRPCYADFAR